MQSGRNSPTGARLGSGLRLQQAALLAPYVWTSHRIEDKHLDARRRANRRHAIRPVIACDNPSAARQPWYDWHAVHYIVVCVCVCFFLYAYRLLYSRPLARYTNCHVCCILRVTIRILVFFFRFELLNILQQFQIAAALPIPWKSDRWAIILNCS